MNQNYEFFQDCLDQFHVRGPDLEECGRTIVPQPKAAPGQKRARTTRRVDYQELLRPFFNNDKPGTKIEEELDNNDPSLMRKFYKDHLINAKELKFVRLQKAINSV